MPQMISFLLIRIGIKFDAYKLKKLIDLVFIFIEKIITNLNKLIPYYLDFYEEIVNREIDMADISKSDNVLHIGCGSIPATSILIEKKIGAKITGIDNNIPSIKQAIKLLKRINLSDKINILYGDALNFPVKKYDLIIVSQGIKQYDRALKYISKSIEKDARVIFRTSSDINGKLTLNDKFIEKIFSIKDIVAHRKNGLLISILIQKNLIII
jgi:hypothetical protein